MQRCVRVTAGLAAVGAGLGAALLSAAPAWADPLNPASPQARLHNELFWLTIGLAALVLIAVEALILYTSFRFRRPPSAELDDEPLQIHGHTRLELMWTLLPGLLLVFLFLISARAMAEAAAEPKDARRVQVVARQFLWEFAYQDAGLKTTNDLRVPVGQPVVLELTSGDVIHSFWVPDLAGKVDANPGITTKLTFTAERAGQYRGVCTELCGVGHGSMLFTVTAMEPPEFEAWLQGGGGAPVAAAPVAAGPAAADVARAKQLMMDKGCGACHKIAGVDGLTGAVGPELSKVGSVAGQRKPGTSAEAYLNESIANPTAFVVQGFPPVMPQIPMSDDEHSTIVKYLLTLK